ncbi:hypothetical protein MD484_g369, partial [Candolleomyces efflorescens]
MLDETEDAIAQFNIVITAKISRHDFPQNWPNLLTDLMTVIDTNLQKRYVQNSNDPRDALMLRRSLQLVNAILKELASVKMINGVKVMANIVEQVRQIFYGYYSTIAQNFSSSALTNLPDATRFQEDIFLGQLVLKPIVKMAVWLWHRIDKQQKEEYAANQDWVADLFQNCALQIQNIVSLRKEMVNAIRQNPAMSTYLPAVKILTKHITTFGKFFRRMQILNHQRFALLPMCGELVLFYWSQVVDASSQRDNSIAGEFSSISSQSTSPQISPDSDEVLYPLRFLVQGMALFKENLAQWSVLRRDGTPNKNSLSKEFVENAVRLLVSQFMPLNPSDLERWMADPEEWLNEEERDEEHWEYEIRACVFVPFLHIQPTPDLPGILQKEALYCAIGRCAIRLKDRLPFADWLEKTLAVEALSQDPKYASDILNQYPFTHFIVRFPIIKRRIAWLIGKWVSDQCSSPNNPRIWEILVHLLKDRSTGTDTVVRLTAAKAVKECVDTLEFSAEVFSPFLQDTVTELVRLMDEADTSESKCRIATTLSAVLEQTKDMVTPFMGIIAEPIPRLWTAAGEDWLLKGTMLVTVTKLVEAAKDRSSALENITVPLIQESLSPGVMTNLDEDGLVLWLAAIRNAPAGGNRTGSPSLLSLYPRALYLLATNLDLLGKITGILESYFFLDAPALLQNYSKDIFQAFTEGLKSQAVMVNMKDMVMALQFMVQLAPSNLWGEPMHTSGLFSYLLLTLNDGESSPILLTEIIFLFSRIVMADPQMFLQLMSATAPVANLPETNLWEGLLDQWWGKFDNMSEPRHRKLTAMGIATLVATGRPEVLKRLSGEIFNLWLDVFGEIKETRLLHEEDPTNLELVSPTNLRRHWELDEAPRDYYQDSEGTPEFDRRKALYDRDAIRVVQLNEYVRAHLGQAEAVVGPNFQVYLKDADPTVLEQIQAELKN